MVTVLIIEEEEVIRGFVRVILQNAGHNAVEAGNGEAGLQLVKRGTVDAVIVDYMGRVGDGIGALKRLRADAATAHIPVVAMCGLGQSGEEAALWANSLVVKPFRPAQLLMKVQATLETKRRPFASPELRPIATIMPVPA